jgi:alpha-tubulin suppressor-like RCC1 family protein
MAITYKVLGQINPAAATVTTLYTVPATVSAVVSTIVMCNQAATATTFSLSIRPAGATVDTKHYLNYNTAISANDTIPLTLGLTLAPTDVLTATSASGSVSFSAFGAESTLATSAAPIITNMYITNSSYVTQADTVLPPAGGYIKLIGMGFIDGCVIYINGVAVTTTVVSSTELRAALSAKTAATYSVMMFNPNGSGAIYANGIVYSSIPSWTASSYSNPTTGNVVNVQLLATGDVPLVYSLQGGSSLPVGVTLSSTGLVSGTATGISSTTTVTFTVVVTDPQSQSIPQLISLSLTFYIGKLYSWGYNNNGQLGDGTTSNRSSPTQVGALITWLNASGGSNHSAAIKTDGSLWNWGLTTHGQLGDGTTVNKSSPVQIGLLTDWLSMSCGGFHTSVIKTNSTLWSWGENYNGQLGDSTITNKSSPVQVGALTNWSSSAGGRLHTSAIKTDGTLWTWGVNNNGQLGLGDTLDRSSPVQVGTLTTWLKIASGTYHTLALTASGTLWTWGNNFYGQLGHGNTIHRSSPTQVGVLANWSSVPSMAYGSAAIKTDGSLWSWGFSNFGQLGLGDTSNRSSPVQVGTLTTWLKIASGYGHALATKTDGTLWIWGKNSNFGQLGLGDAISRSSPTQVGALTTWLTVAAGYHHSLATSS